MIFCRLEFQCTNNTIKYKAFTQGVKKVIDLGAYIIQFFGDSEIIVKQVRDHIHFLAPRLLKYKTLVMDMTNSFQDFNINSIPKLENYDANLLANTTS